MDEQARRGRRRSSTSAARRSSGRATRSPGSGTLVSIGSHDTHWGRLDLRHVYSKNLRILGTNLGSILELRTLLESRGATDA